MEEETVKLLHQFSDKYNLKINENALVDHKFNNYTNLAFFINELFPDNSTGFVLEQGSPPSDYYPALISTLAKTTINEFNPEKLIIYSEDDWETANVSFSINDQNINFNIEGVDDSDWVSTTFINSMNNFAEKHLSGLWVEFIGEDWCTCLYLPKNAISEFNEIRKTTMIFGIDHLLECCRNGDPNYDLAELVMSVEDINSVDSNGDLALNVAIKNGLTDRLWIISEQGNPCLNPNAKDKWGKSSFDIATELGLEDVQKNLKEYAETYEWWLKNNK